jgi:uncharacterized protein (DUF2252 family)
LARLARGHGEERERRVTRDLVRHVAFLFASAALVALSCGDAAGDAREDELIAVLAEADAPMIRARPALAAGKYARMAASPVDFLRGSLPLYRHDARSGTTTVSVSRFALDVPLVPSLGDPHVENFGALRASDGTTGLEPNDFDAADRAPFLWDVRRLAVSVALSGFVSGGADSAVRGATRAAVEGYRVAVERAASGLRLARVTAETTAGNPILDDVFRRSERDHASRRELDEVTEKSEGARRLRRGAVDPEDPQSVLAELPRSAYGSLPAAIDAWRATLLAPPPPENFVLLDAVRELGSGVASWPRVRVLLLVRGPSDAPDDDLLLELKELADSGIAGLYPPGVHHDDVGLRVLETSREAWARPDAAPLWGVTRWLGLRCQIRLDSEGQKGVRVSRMVDERGTPEALAALGGVLGAIVARVHTSGPDGLSNAQAIYARTVVDPALFVAEQTDVALAYARATLADHARFRRGLARRGPALGVPFDLADAPSPDFAALLGTPPPPPSLIP